MNTATDAGTRRIPGSRVAAAIEAAQAADTLSARQAKWAATCKALENAIDTFILDAAALGADYGTVASNLSDRFGAFRWYLSERVMNVRAQIAAGARR